MDRTDYNQNYYQQNKVRINKQSNKRYYANHELSLQQRRDYYKNNKEKIRNQQNKKYQSDQKWRVRKLQINHDWYNNLSKSKKEELLEKNRKRRNKFYKTKYKPVRQEWERIIHDTVKYEVMELCGNNKAACVICGIDDIDLLTIDHKNGRNGDTRKTRDKNNNNYGYKLWRKIIYNQLDKSEFQTLCMNCNWKRHLNRIRKVAS